MPISLDDTRRIIELEQKLSVKVIDLGGEYYSVNMKSLSVRCPDPHYLMAFLKGAETMYDLLTYKKG